MSKGWSKGNILGAVMLATPFGFFAVVGLIYGNYIHDSLTLSE